MTALRFDIFVTPMERTIVTTAARPSGIAATARLTASMKVSSSTSAENFPARMTPVTNMTIQMAMTIYVRILDSDASFF